MTRRRWVTPLAVVAAVSAVLSPVVPTAATGATAPSCESKQLHHAPIVTGDVRDDGRPVAASDDRRGKRVPVVLVGGIGDEGTVDADQRRGPFAHAVDLSSGTTPVGVAGRSLLGELQNLPGTDVFTFDTTGFDEAWVDDSHLGPALGGALDCLRATSGEKAVVVTRSTGGLVARWALTHPGSKGQQRADEVSTVVTFGSPESGSLLGLLAQGGLAAAEQAGVTQAATLAGTVRLLAAHCAAAGAAGTDGSLCQQLGQVVRYGGAPVAAALVPGSRQLRSLPAWPSGVAVHALTAAVSLTPGEHGWFGAVGAAAPVAAGDLLDLGPALSGAAPATVACGLTLDPAAWTLRATDSDDPGTGVADAVAPCLAGDLTRNADLVESARKLVLADLFARQPLIASDLADAPIPSLCRGYWPAGVLTNGAYAGPNPDPNGYAFPPTLAKTDSYHPGPLQVFGDLDGDGVGDAAAVIGCNQGGVGWPDTVVFWGSGLRLLGAYFMGDAVGDARGGSRSLTLTDGKVVVDSLDSRDWDGGCCASGNAKVTLGFDGSKVVATDVQHLQGPRDLTFSGIGDVEIGMSRSALEALGAVKSPYGGYSCSRYDVGDLDVSVDNATGDVIRVDLPYEYQQFAHTFPEGVGVGSTLAEVYQAYQGHTIDNLLDGGFGQGSDGVLVHGDPGYLGFGTSDGTTVDYVTVSDKNYFGSMEYCSG